MKYLQLACLAFLIAAPAFGQEVMTFGHEAPLVTQKTYTRTRIPKGSTVIIKDPDACHPPTMFIGQSIHVLDNKRINKPVRIVRPGDAMTMDHNPQRLNFILDQNEIIRNIMCG